MQHIIENLPIHIPYDQIAQFCQKWGVIEVALFGSVLRDDFSPDSDVDILLTFAPDAIYTLFDLVEMHHDLRDVVGRDVDIVDRRAMEQSHNYIRRNAILETYQVIYAP
ncbi:MAG: nucleotidyltransferase domain-containing protein [Anaerolineae bacterium]|nr:nucleotidyltransferase domain-containing protein [Anaerolineae bacterium]